MLPMPIDTNWLMNRQVYGPDEARRMQKEAWGQIWAEPDSPAPPADRNAWLIAAVHRTTVREAFASFLSRVSRLVAPLPAARQP